MKNLTKKQKITYVVITIIILAIIGAIIGVVTHKAKKPELIECKETEQQVEKKEEVTNELPKDYKGEVDIVEEEIEVKGKDGKVEKKVVRKAVPKGQGKGKVVGTTNTNKMNTTKPNTTNTTKPNTTKPKEPVNNNPILTFTRRLSENSNMMVYDGFDGKPMLIIKNGKEYDVLDSWEREEYWTDMRTNPETIIETTPDGGMVYKTEKLWSKTYEQMWKDQDKWRNSQKYGKVDGWGPETVHYYKVRQRVTPYKW